MPETPDIPPFLPIERMPLSELRLRWAKCRDLLQRDCPEAGGLLVFSKIAIYWLTGTMASGVLWLPLARPGQGDEPVFFVRKGAERAALESSLTDILPFRSYKDIPGLCVEAGAPLADAVAVEMSGLTWQLGASLAKALAGHGETRLLSGDAVLAKAQMVKTSWELAKMRLAGERHGRALHDRIPARIRPGMTERAIAHACWDVFWELGHSGPLRMAAFGEECFLGHVSAGDSGNYPSSFNGPLGLRGEHPATPVMGYAGKVWQRGEPLALDVGFTLEGYMTDKTQPFFAGPPATLPERARAGHEVCAEITRRTAARMVPGAIPSELYADALRYAEKAGFAEGFMGLDGNKVKFLGHGIGLVIDAWPVLAKGFDEPLQTGMTIAVEPKMGLPGFGMLGLENTFEVTDHGGVSLTGDDYGIVFVE